MGDPSSLWESLVAPGVPEVALSEDDLMGLTFQRLFSNAIMDNYEYSDARTKLIATLLAEAKQSGVKINRGEFDEDIDCVFNLYNEDTDDAPCPVCGHREGCSGGEGDLSLQERVVREETLLRNFGARTSTGGSGDIHSAVLAGHREVQDASGDAGLGGGGAGRPEDSGPHRVELGDHFIPDDEHGAPSETAGIGPAPNRAPSGDVAPGGERRGGADPARGRESDRERFIRAILTGVIPADPSSR